MIVNSRTPLGAGCFRTETFNVTVRGTKTPTLLNVFVCPGKSTTINGVVYTYANITDGQRVNINTIDAFGCNNTTIYTLRKDTYEPGAPQNAEFCQGGSFTFRGVQYTSTQNVIIPNTGTGCDTLYPIIIRVRPVYVGANTTQNVKTICLR